MSLTFITNLKGSKGDQGIPGPGAVPADDAVAGFVSNATPTATQTALDARYAQMWSINVASHGATGDGVTDDTAAIESARAALAAKGGGVLQFGPAGKRYLVNSISVSSGIRYSGEGATIIGTSATPEGIFQAVGWTDGTTISDSTIDGFLIDGGAAARRAVFLTKANYCRVANNRIFNLGVDTAAAQNAIRLHFDTKSCWVEKNHITMGIDSPFGALASSVGIYMVSNTPDLQGGGQNDTLTFASATSLSQRHTITGNVVFNGTHSISLSGATDCVVSDNNVTGPTHRGIILSPIALRNIVANNRIAEFGSTGIHMAWGSCRNVITGNLLTTTVSGLEGNGVKGYYGCSDNVVVGNYINGCMHGSIRFAMGSVRNLISSNRVVGGDVGIQIQSGLPAASGYYQPAAVSGITSTTIIGNTLTECGKSVEFEASGTAGISGVVLGQNLSDSPTTVAYAITELSSSAVSVVQAVGNMSVGTTAHWALARGERHFAQKSANTSLADTPTVGALRSGMYYQATPSTSISTAVLGIGVFRATPFHVPNDVTLSSIGLEVTAAGDAGSRLRIGIYADDAFGYPKVLVADCGTIAGDVVAVAEIAVALKLTAGTYWVGAVPQLVTTVQPTVRALTPASGVSSEAIPLTPGTTPSANLIPSFGFSTLGVTAALPATFQTVVAQSGTAPRIFVKIA